MKDENRDNRYGNYASRAEVAVMTGTAQPAKQRDNCRERGIQYHQRYAWIDECMIFLDRANHDLLLAAEREAA